MTAPGDWGGEVLIFFSVIFSIANILCFVGNKTQSRPLKSLKIRKSCIKRDAIMVILKPFDTELSLLNLNL